MSDRRKRSYQKDPLHKLAHRTTMNRGSKTVDKVKKRALEQQSDRLSKEICDGIPPDF